MPAFGGPSPDRGMTQAKVRQRSWLLRPIGAGVVFLGQRKGDLQVKTGPCPLALLPPAVQFIADRLPQTGGQVALSQLSDDPLGGVLGRVSDTVLIQLQAVDCGLFRLGPFHRLVQRRRRRVAVAKIVEPRDLLHDTLERVVGVLRQFPPRLDIRRRLQRTAQALIGGVQIDVRSLGKVIGQRDQQRLGRLRCGLVRRRHGQQAFRVAVGFFKVGFVRT